MRKRGRMSKFKMLKVTGAIIALFSFLTIIWSTAFYVSSSILDALAIHLSPFVTYLISDILSFIFMILVWILIAVLMRPKREAMIWTIIEPIQKIAKGDFSVKIRNEEKYDGEIGVLVKSINDMTDELNAMEKLVRNLFRMFLMKYSHH